MKEQWKRTLRGALLGAALLAMAGCGSTNVMDTYSFGHQVIRAGQSEITIALPYEMGKSTKNMTDDGYPIDIYGSVTEHMVIEVEALRAGVNKPLPTVDEQINRSKTEFANLGATIKEESVQLEGATAKKLDVTYSAQGQTFSFSQYVFMDHDVLWNIVYQYPAQDQVGADISKEIKDKIQVTQQKEG
ncbi:hypothetical protein [Veillonella sp. AS16]|uniref:hypothetical protein n=1 Tax=Veillonella sp. AS16 TaxID=936589 RepID=UPI00056E47D1|nr:hypothetical protein [Veillonella sp. AS16]